MGNPSESVFAMIQAQCVYSALGIWTIPYRPRVYYLNALRNYKVSFKLQNELPREQSLCYPSGQYMGLLWQPFVLIFIPVLAEVSRVVLSCLFYEYAVIKCTFLCLAVSFYFVRLCGSLNMAFDPGGEFL